MDTQLFWTILTTLTLVSFWIGSKAGTSTKNSDNYYLADRSLGATTLAITILATQIGGGAVLGACDTAYNAGWQVAFYPLGSFLGLTFLAIGFGAKLRTMQLTTVSEIFEKVYRSKRLRKIAALLSIISLFFILVAQAIAARKFLYALHVESTLFFTLFWAVIIGYTVLGGIKAVVYTDILQALFILFAFAITFGYISYVPPETTVASSFTGESTPIGWMLMPFLFMIIEQDMGQRCFAAKTPKTVSRAAFLAAILFLLLSLIPIYFGITARNLGIESTPARSVLIDFITQCTTPKIAAIFNCAILMALVSTADSLLCSISSNISFDFAAIRSLPDKKNIFYCRLITFFVGSFSLILSYFFTDVVSVIIFSYELAVMILFVPVLMAISLKKPNRNGAIIAMIFGAISFFSCQIWQAPLPRELITLFFSFAGFGIGSLLPEERKIYA